MYKIKEGKLMMDNNLLKEKSKKQHLYLLKIILFISAFGWGISVIGTFLPWTIVEDILSNFGCNKIDQEPMIDYWFRMTTGGFSFIGFIFLVVAFNPEKYKNIINLLGYFMICEGGLLLFHGLRLSLQPFPFFGDVFFCIFCGGMILYLQKNNKIIK